MAKLTPWFPPEIQPVYIGRFHRYFGKGIIHIDYWDGKQWMFFAGDTKRWVAGTNSFPWRGLAEKPKDEK